MSGIAGNTADKSFLAPYLFKKGGNNNMLKKDLVDRIATDAGLTKKQAAAAVDSMLDTITSALRSGDTVLLTGFGKFEVRNRAARVGINPKTLEKINLPATKVPAFKAGKGLKVAVK